MSEIKHVLSDLDDTLAPHMKHEISAANRQAVIDVEDQGVIVSVVTGRAYTHARDTLNILGVEGPCVFDGGATVANPVSGEILWQKWLSVTVARRILGLLQPYCQEAYYSSSNEMVEIRNMSLDVVTEDSPSIFALADSHDILGELEADIRALPDVAVFTGVGTHPDSGRKSPALHIMHAEADKFHGVEALRKIVKIPREQTLAIGDGDNDLPLFKNAGRKVAMGNATDKLKAAADYVVGTLEEDGFAEAMRRFVLSPKEKA